MATLYYSIYAAATADPTAAQIKSGLSWGGALAAGSQTSPTVTSSPTFTEISALTGGTDYKIRFAWSDGTTDVLSSSYSFSTLVARRAIIIQSGLLAILPIGQEGTGKKPLVLVDGDIRERIASEGLPITFDSDGLRTLDVSETLII